MNFNQHLKQINIGYIYIVFLLKVQMFMKLFQAFKI